MSDRPSDKDLDRTAHQTEKHHQAAHRALAVQAVTRWNSFMRSVGRSGYSPQIGVAIAARFYFLDLFCPGCRQVKQVDLRTLDRHPTTKIEALIPALSCRDCRPSPPFAHLLGLSEREWQSDNRPAYAPPRSR